MAKIKEPYSISFFGRMSNSFSSGPQNYYKAWRKQKGLSKAFLGPWNYAGGSPGSKPKRKVYEYGANRTHALSQE